MSRKDDPPSQPAVASPDATCLPFAGLHALARRSLRERYAIVFFDHLPATLRCLNEADRLGIWFAVGMAPDGCNDVLGMWLPGRDGLDWPGVASELIYRGVRDILMTVAPPEAAAHAAIEGAFPASIVLPSLLSASDIERAGVPERDSPALAGQIAPSIRDLLSSDIARSLSDRLGRCGVRTPMIFADRETALITTSYIVALAAAGWSVAPERWRAARDDLATTFGGRFG